MEQKTRNQSQKKKEEVEILCEVCGRFRKETGWCKHCETYHCIKCARQSIDGLRAMEHLEIWW